MYEGVYVCVSERVGVCVCAGRYCYSRADVVVVVSGSVLIL